MQPSDFYPSAWSDDRMDYSPTELVQNIPITTTEFTQAYWLGWRAWENVPQQYHISRYDGGTFTDATKPENVPVGFAVCDSGSENINYRFSQLLTNNGTKWQDITSCYFPYAATLNTRLPNSLNINTTLWGVLRLQFYGLAYVGGDIVEVTASATATIEQLLNKETIFATFSNPVGTQQINLEDFTEHSIAEYTSSGGVPYKIVLGMYKIEYARDVSKTGEAIGYQCPRPMLQIHTADDKPYIEAITIPVNYNNTDNFGWGSGTYGNGFFMNYDGSIRDGCVRNEIGGTVDIMGGYVGSIDFSAITTDEKTLNVFGNFYCRGLQRNDYFIVGRVFTLDEIIKSITLLPRYKDSTGTNTYANAGYLYSKVDLETNEFLPEFVAGEDTALLTDWQKIGGTINDDDFTKDDIPEYVPEPSDEPDAYGADSIPDLNFSAGAISDFVTMYCLTEQQVSAFGAYLWANIFSENFVRSIGTILVNDFSINPSDILNYIISLRKYPFDLYGKNGYENISQGSLYFGRGVAGIPISGAFGKMQNLAGTFGGEYIEIPAKYNDFRDYEPFTRITVFVPFCGSIELTPSEVVGKRIFITYTVDYSTGNVQADVWVNSDVAFIVGTVTGQIGATVQTTASNNMEVLQKVGSTAANFVKTVASVAAIAATGGVAAESAMAGEISGAEATAKEMGAVSSMLNVTTGALANAPAVNSNPIHSSSVGSGFAAFATPRARLIVERRKYQVPTNYDHVYGKTTNVTVTLSTLENKGFTVCKNVDLSGIPATQDELSAIESLLTSGVYF